MIDNKECRIGNFFETQVQDLIKVDTITPENVIFAVVDRDRYPLIYKWQAQPIPISGDWLERFGFIKSKASEFDRHYVYERNNIKIFSLYDADFIFNDKRVNWIHQLQNLVFILTGEELKLK